MILKSCVELQICLSVPPRRRWLMPAFAIFERFQEAKCQSAAFKQFLPSCRSRSLGAASKKQPHTSPASSSYMPMQKESVAARAPPQRA